MFVINYSKVEVIKYELSGKIYHSNVERSDALKNLIDSRGEEIFILPLQGYIFFGTSNRILEKIQDRLDDKELIDLKFLIFNFFQVTGIDSSTINSLNKLRIMAENNNFSVLFCSLDKTMRNQFTTEGLLPDEQKIFQEFDDLDHGLEWCENEIINLNYRIQDRGLKKDREDNFKKKFSQLYEYFEKKEFPQETVLIEQGKNPGGIFFIESGRVTVQLHSENGDIMRLKSMGEGTVVGEVSLYLGSIASATVITEKDCKIYFLSKENFQKINLESPEKATELHTYIVKLLSDRLAKSNDTIKALMR